MTELSPGKITVRGKAVIIYDMELATMFIKDWAAKGMSRTEIEDLLLS